MSRLTRMMALSFLANASGALLARRVNIARRPLPPSASAPVTLPSFGSVLLGPSDLVSFALCAVMPLSSLARFKLPLALRFALVWSLRGWSTVTLVTLTTLP